MKAARTSLFRQIRSLLHESLPVGDSPGRRRFLKMAGAAVATMGLGVRDVFAADKKGGAVAIVGGGIAGLTCAYRLMKAGREVHLFEASERLGGRMYTKDDFNKEGMFVELGGELVDSNHTDLLELAKELGLETQNLLVGDKGEDAFYLCGKRYTHHEIVKGFKPLGAIIAADVEKLYDEDDNFTDYAVELDKVSMADYLKKASATVEPWVIEFIIAAYEPEYGIDADLMSCLNLVDFIDPDTSEGFKIFGESDESMRIKGGNGKLPAAVAKALEGKISSQTGVRLTSISLNDEGFSLLFQSKAGEKKVMFPTVVLALPFTQLRKVEGVFDLPLSDDKKRAIREMGYGMNVKVMAGFDKRYWREKQEGREETGNGSIFADAKTFQNVWETSRAQEGESGIITNLVGGKRAINYAADSFAPYLEELDVVYPGMKAGYDGNKAVMNWPKMPFNEGSYSCPLVGQYVWLYEAAATPECEGRLVFAGEHTSMVSCGYMNGGVESGNRSAKEVLGKQ